MDHRALVYHPNRVRHLYGRTEYIAAGERWSGMLDEWQVKHPGEGLPMSICEMLELERGFDAMGLSEPERAAIEESGPAVEMAVEEFIRSGRNIFDVSRLVPSFRNTSVDEVEPWLLKLPFPFIYLHFGEMAGLPSPFPGVVVEGAYVGRDDDDSAEGFAIRIEFVCSYPDCETMRTLSLAEAHRRSARGFSMRINVDDTIPIAIADASRETWSLASPLWAPFLPEAVRVVFNTLCYLDYDERDIEEAFPEAAPERLVRQAVSGSPKERRRAESKLDAIGYTIVRFCGRRTFPPLGGSGTDGPLIGPHWRRGHWRHQAYGSGRTERRLRWIRPTVVNAHHGDPATGHIYVGGDNTGKGRLS